MTVNVMDRIMSTSIIVLDQTFNANYVDIMVFEPSVLFPPAAVWGGGELNTWSDPTFGRFRRRAIFI